MFVISEFYCINRLARQTAIRRCHVPLSVLFGDSLVILRAGNYPSSAGSGTDGFYTYISALRLWRDGAGCSIYKGTEGQKEPREIISGGH